jgi:hypothetical protein
MADVMMRWTLFAQPSPALALLWRIRVDSIYLHGSEDVSRAASSMSRAADEMQRAASNMAEVLERQQRFLDDWLMRFDAALSRARATQETNSE